MCGIFGIISKKGNAFLPSDQNLFTNMLVCGAIRGDDATGIFGVEKNGEVDYLKIAGNPYHILYSAEYKTFFNKMWNNYNIVIGHNRKATQGSAGDSNNAHPFVEKGSILVHNGTILNHKELKDVTVDSNAILHSIIDIGYKDTLAKIEGAFSLVWYNSEEETLYVCRNDERPLFFAETEKNLVLASEKGMLHWLLERETSYYNIKNIIGDINSFKVGKIYKFKYEKDGLKVEEEDITLFEKKDTYSNISSSYPIPKEAKKEPIKEKGGEVKDIFTGAFTSKSEVYKVGDTAAMYIMDYQMYKKPSADGTTGLIRGKHVDNPGIEMVCLFKGDENTIEDLIDYDYISVIIRSIVLSTTATSVKRLVSHSPVPERFVYSKNFVALTTENWRRMDKTCNGCGKTIKFDEVEKTIIKFNKIKTTSRIRCKECMEKIERNLDE